MKFSYSQYDEWRIAANTFTATSNIASLDKQAQVVFVGKCLSQDFKDNLTAKQILKFDGSMGWIEAIEAINLVFEENHSTLVVRNEFMTMRKRQGESETNFLGRLTSVGIRCDMASMATEDWIATRYLASCPSNIREDI